MSAVSPLPHDYEVEPGPAKARTAMGVVILGLLVVALAATGFGALAARQAPGVGAAALVGACGLVLLLMVYVVAITFFAVPRMRFHVGARRFEVRTMFGDRRWSTEALRARRYAPRSGVRIFGTGMAGYMTGWFLLDGRKTRVYATSIRDGVLLEDGASRLFVTPANPQGMLESLRLAGVTVEPDERASTAGLSPDGAAGRREAPRPRWRVILVVVLAVAPALALVPWLVKWMSPKYTHEGALTIEGAAFDPVTCHVLAREVGIEMTDSRGARLVLVLPSASRSPSAWETVRSAPRLFWRAPGADEVELPAGEAGMLTLTGEGYHASGKRAVGGRIAVASGGRFTVTGEVAFEGCF